jgi:hypothetical protein
MDRERLKVVRLLNNNNRFNYTWQHSAAAVTRRADLVEIGLAGSLASRVCAIDD